MWSSIDGSTQALWHLLVSARDRRTLLDCRFQKIQPTKFQISNTSCPHSPHACVHLHMCSGSNPRFTHCFVDEDAMAWTKSILVKHKTCLQCWVMLVLTQRHQCIRKQVDGKDGKDGKVDGSRFRSFVRYSIDFPWFGSSISRYISEGTPTPSNQVDHSMWQNAATRLHCGLLWGLGWNVHWTLAVYRDRRWSFFSRIWATKMKVKKFLGQSGSHGIWPFAQTMS